jgi:hypothetical protein
VLAAAIVTHQHRQLKLLDGSLTELSQIDTIAAQKAQWFSRGGVVD